MPNYLVRRLLILGGLAIIGIIFIQSYWVLKTYDQREKDFHLSVSIALKNVAQSIASFNESELPKRDLITRNASHYYVNINDVINANILEDYLIREFNRMSLNTDFEYAVYDCASQNIVYGNYCRLSTDTQEYSRSEVFPKIDDLLYYFVVKFPSKTGYLLSSMWMSLVYSAIALLAVLFFIYSIWVILQQRRFSEMQKDFINNMTHEFKTPISSIKIASEVLLRDDKLKSDPRLMQYTSIIKEQNLRLNNQVEKVLSLAKLEKDSFSLKKETVEIKKVLDDMISTEQLRIAESSVEGVINSDLNCLAGLNVDADRVHLTNMIYNVMDNAIKYSHGKVDVHISAEKNNDFITLKFSDKGIGMKKEELKKIFKKFYRVSTGNIHDVKGFGLGLFYVKNICDSHNWQLEIDSEIDQGTRVSIKMPIKK